RQSIRRRHPGVPGAAVGDWVGRIGLQFGLATCAMNVFLRWLPPAILAIYLTVALIGLIGWPSEIGARLALWAGAYMVVFCFLWAGEYWGYMYSSVMVLGALRAPPALCDLWRAALSAR